MSKRHAAIQALETLPENQREEAAELVLDLVQQLRSLVGPSLLSEAQLADLRERMKNPGPLATDEEADALFERFGA